MGCRRKAPATELVRLVRTEDGGLAVGRRAPGRGAWLCLAEAPEATVEPGEHPAVSERCLDLAVRRNAFARALRNPVAADAIEALRAKTGKRARIEGRGD